MSMKPSQQEHGIILESLNEIDTAAKAVTFLGERLDGGSREAVLHLGRVLTDQSTVLQALSPVQERVAALGAGEHEPSTCLEVGHSENQFDSMVVQKSLDVAAKGHPDELVRQSAADMVYSYQSATYNGAMGPTPEV